MQDFLRSLIILWDRLFMKLFSKMFSSPSEYPQLHNLFSSLLIALRSSDLSHDQLPHSFLFHWFPHELQIFFCKFVFLMILPKFTQFHSLGAQDFLLNAASFPLKRFFSSQSIPSPGSIFLHLLWRSDFRLQSYFLLQTSAQTHIIYFLSSLHLIKFCWWSPVQEQEPTQS